ncbi:MAG TPA: HAD family hydrolase [Symbiobacteriaceae bacterium]|nr:HAD family hydrolase [Symbiobacteriaceae bacterium]
MGPAGESLPEGARSGGDKYVLYQPQGAPSTESVDVPPFRQQQAFQSLPPNTSPMQYKTYLFDLDDTLVPYAARAARAQASLIAAGVDPVRLRELDVTLWPSVAAGQLSIEAKWYRQAVESGASPAQADAFVQTMCQFELAFPEVLPLLQRLQGADRKLGIITNGPPGAHQRQKLAVAGLERFFGEFVFISSEVGAAKPDPRIFHHALQALGSRPEEALFVGDSLPGDAGGALGAGLAAYWLDLHQTGAAVPPGIQRITTLTQLP